jgi:hypothetical protein
MEVLEFKDNFFRNKPNKLELKNFELGEIVGTGKKSQNNLFKVALLELEFQKI